MIVAKLKSGAEFKHIATGKTHTTIEDKNGTRKTIKNYEVLEVGEKKEQKPVSRYKRVKIIFVKYLIDKLIKFANQ
jgi:hypothetical protein